MALVLRTGLGRNLTAAEFDDNNLFLQARIAALEAAPATANGIASFSIVGNQLTITMDDTTQHVITLPSAAWSFGGEWTDATVYTQNKVLTVAGSLYLVTFNHLSVAPFDAAANDGLGHSYYAKILDPPAQPYDLHIFIADTMQDDQLIFLSEATRAWQLPIDLAGSFFDAIAPADDETIVTLKKNGVEIGTLTWAVGQFVPTIDFDTPITFEIGDNFSINAPAVADTTLASVSFDLKGSRV